MANVDIKTAALILEQSLIEATPETDELGNLINDVLTGSHKTYRYILVNALLAKSTNKDIDPLSLQKAMGRKVNMMRELYAIRS